MLSESGTSSCFKVSTSYATASTGRIFTENSSTLSLCYSGTIPSGSTVESGVTLNSNAQVCSGCTQTAPDPVTAPEALFNCSENNNDNNNTSACSVTWTGTTQTGSIISNLPAGTYVATITCGGCIKNETVVVGNPTGTPVSIQLLSSTNSNNSPSNALT